MVLNNHIEVVDKSTNAKMSTGRIVRRPPAEPEFASAAHRFWFEVCLHLNCEGLIISVGKNNQVDSRICCHWSRLDSMSQYAEMHNKPPAFPDLLFYRSESPFASQFRSQRHMADNVCGNSAVFAQTVNSQVSVNGNTERDS